MGGLLSDGDNNPRLKALRTFAEQRPQDPFPRYALGMELKSGGDAQGAWATFEALIVEHPDYIACYAPAGEVLVVLGRIDDARAVYGKGIEACVRIGNPHMRANLEDVLAALGE